MFSLLEPCFYYSGSLYNNNRIEPGTGPAQRHKTMHNPLHKSDRPMKSAAISLTSASKPCPDLVEPEIQPYKVAILAIVSSFTEQYIVFISQELEHHE